MEADINLGCGAEDEKDSGWQTLLLDVIKIVRYFLQIGHVTSEYLND